MQITEPTSALALLSSKVFLQQVQDYIASLKTVNDNTALSKFIKDEFNILNTYYIAIGDQELHKISTTVEDRDDDEVYLLHYAIPEAFKDITILHRDIALQLHIARHKKTESVVTTENVRAHFEASKELIENALSAFVETVMDERNAIYESAKRKGKLLSSIKHRTNPWDIYKAQFEVLQSQIKNIDSTTIATNRALKSFEDIRAYNKAFLEEIIENTERLKKNLGEAIKMVKGLNNQQEISDTISWIDKTIKNIAKESTLKVAYGDNAELKIKPLTDLTLPVGTDNGLLLTKKIDFNKVVDKWIDYEVMPALIDLWDNKSNIESYFKHSLGNLKTSLLIAKNNRDLETMPSQLQTLQNVHHTIADNGLKSYKIIAEIETKFDTHFLFSNIYTKEIFLEVSLQSSLTNFASDQSTFFSNVKKKLNDTFLKINGKYDHSKLFTIQNKVEQSIDSINYRMFKENNAQYDTLFLNKKFIGDLFLLPRKVQEHTLIKSIDQWHNGFNKAILVTGDVLSGKSTFVEYIGQQHFKKNTINLLRNATITVGGRKFTTTVNLKEALQNIKKGLSGARLLLIIDNLELWRDETTSLLENTRALLSFIASESNNVLVIVTTSKQMQSHIDKRLRFSEAFSTSVSLNKSTFEEIYKAVMLRHGASHKQLVSVKHEVLTPKQIEQCVLKLSRKLNYNIGEVLQAWTYGTTMVDNNKVVYEDKDTGFKDFFNTEEIIILKYILLYKNITEKDLNTFVGTAYDSGYKSSLKRLTNTKVLLRQDEGQLILNKVVAMDIKQILIYRGTIN